MQYEVLRETPEAAVQLQGVEEAGALLQISLIKYLFIYLFI